MQSNHIVKCVTAHCCVLFRCNQTLTNTSEGKSGTDFGMRFCSFFSGSSLGSWKLQEDHPNKQKINNVPSTQITQILLSLPNTKQ